MKPSPDSSVSESVLVSFVAMMSGNDRRPRCYVPHAVANGAQPHVIAAVVHGWPSDLVMPSHSAQGPMRQGPDSLKDQP